MTGIDATDRARLTVIYDLLDRYQQLPKDKMLPLLAVRILCLQHGYGVVTKTALDIGIDNVVTAAKAQLFGIASLWQKMVEIEPPPDEIKDDVLDNIDTVRRSASDANVAAHLYKQVTRMVLREQWLKFHKEPKAEGETVQ